MTYWQDQDPGPLEQVTTWAETLTFALSERNKAIVKASKKGYSLREIGEAAGLSHSAIAKILAR